MCILDAATELFQYCIQSMQYVFNTVYTVSQYLNDFESIIVCLLGSWLW